MTVLAFAGDYYYPSGGWSDLRGVFPTISEARAVVDAGQETGYSEPDAPKVRPYDWAQIVQDDALVAEMQEDEGWTGACSCGHGWFRHRHFVQGDGTKHTECMHSIHGNKKDCACMCFDEQGIPA